MRGWSNKMSDIKKTIKKQVLPLLPLRGLTVFPHMILHFDVGRSKSIKALEEAMINNQLVFLVTQKDAKNDDPQQADIYNVGTISKVKQLLKLPGDTIRVLVEGVCRAEISEFIQADPFFIVEVSEKIYNYSEESIDIEALKRRVISAFEDYSQLSNKLSPETSVVIESITDASELSDVIGANIPLKMEQKQEILDEFNPVVRLE